MPVKFRRCRLCDVLRRCHVFWWLALAGWLWAAEPALAEAQPLVLFFGGYGANAVDMRAWKAAARRHPRWGARFAFEAIPYPPDAGADERHAVAVAAATIRRLVNWLASTPDREVIFVGHSAGAGLAASVLARLEVARNVRLIVLDDALSAGFVPPKDFIAATQMTCWSAVSGGVGAVNRRQTRALCAAYFELEAPRCRTPVCAHFVLINRNAPPALDFPGSRRLTPQGTTAGYDRLDVNLDWLGSVDRR